LNGREIISGLHTVAAVIIVLLNRRKMLSGDGAATDVIMPGD